MCHFVFDDAKVYIIFGLCKKIEEYFGTFLSTPYYKSRVRMRVDVFSPFLCVFFKGWIIWFSDIISIYLSLR